MKSNLQIATVGQRANEAKDAFKQAFGRALRARLVAKGWNQSDLARTADIGRDAVSTYINGRSFPEPVNLERIAKALGCTVEELMPDYHESEADFVLRQSPDDPSLVTLTINKPIPLALAAEIVERLKSSG